jgi:hypothetical protein
MGPGAHEFPYVPPGIHLMENGSRPEAGSIAKLNPTFPVGVPRPGLASALERGEGLQAYDERGERMRAHRLDDL